MGFSRQEHYSGLPFPSPGGLPNLGTEFVSPALAGKLFTAEPPESLDEDSSSSFIIISLTLVKNLVN